MRWLKNEKKKGGVGEGLVGQSIGTYLGRQVVGNYYGFKGPRILTSMVASCKIVRRVPMLYFSFFFKKPSNNVTLRL